MYVLHVYRVIHYNDFGLESIRFLPPLLVKFSVSLVISALQIVLSRGVFNLKNQSNLSFHRPACRVQVQSCLTNLRVPNTMASALITCIDSALQDVNFLLKCAGSSSFHDMFKDLKFRLRKVKIFVLLSASKTADHESDDHLRFFLLRIQDEIHRLVDQIHPYCLVDFDYHPEDLLRKPVLEFQKEIESFQEEMHEWFRQSTSLVTDGDTSLDVITCVLENLIESFHLMVTSLGVDDLKVFLSEVLVKATGILGEDMAFLKCLVRFAKCANVEESVKDLLARAQTVAIDAAHLSFTLTLFPAELYETERVWKIIETMQTNDPQVYRTCTQVLRRFKSLTQEMDGDQAFITIKSILDFVICKLWDMLQQNTSDQLPDLHQGLRSLRTIIIKLQHPTNCCMNVKKEIGTVACDAGVFILSFYQSYMEVDPGTLGKMIETINTILAQVRVEEDSKTLTSNFPIIHDKGFVEFVLEKLMEQASCEAEPTAKAHIQTIQEEFVFFRSFLGETVELVKEHEELQTLWDRILEMAHRIECLIDHPHPSFDSTIEDIENIKADMLKIFHGNRRMIKAKEVNSTSSLSSGRPISVTNEVVGLDDENELIKDQLMRGSKNLRGIAIVGMPGLGKTTLAAKVYNDNSVSHYFHVSAWSTISQVLGKKRVLLQLLNRIDPNYKGSDMDEHDLADKVRRGLKGRTYLIILDDMWEIEAWNSLRESFPDDGVGSRIIFTSRHHDSVPHDMLIQKPYFLKPLNEDKSMELLRRKLFLDNDGWPLELQDLRRQIVEYCKGLPLTIIVTAGLLTSVESQDWKKILDDFNSGVVSSTEQCKNTLELSYKYLPYYLRPCFLYFGAFPEDEEVSTRKLLHLWMAEGFIPKSKTKNQVDVAEEYLNDLTGRSLVMVARRRSIDEGVKACRIHDLIHGFCLQKAKDENFFHFLKGRDELSAFNEPPNLRRLCIQSKPKHFQESKLFCPGARSLLFSCSQEANMWEEEDLLVNISFVILIFRQLRVLDIEQIRIASVFPKEIELLVQLVFLAIRGNFSHIPSSIGKLSNLETLIVDTIQLNTILLPDSLWGLRRLKYLCIKGTNFGGRFSMQNLESSSILFELDRFSGAFIPCGDSTERLMRKFPNVRHLKCFISLPQDDTENPDKMVVFDILSQLESLHVLRYVLHSRPTMFEFSLPENLKKLTLSIFQLTWRNVSTIGELPHLEVLKFIPISFEGRTLEMKEGEFPKLRVLKFSDVDLIRWTAADDLCLQELVLGSCFGLEEMPSCLDYISSLETIQVIDPSEAVLNLVRRIEEEQKSWGNSGLNIRT